MLRERPPQARCRGDAVARHVAVAAILLVGTGGASACGGLAADDARGFTRDGGASDGGTQVDDDAEFDAGKGDVGATDGEPSDSAAPDAEQDVSTDATTSDAGLDASVIDAGVTDASGDDAGDGGVGSDAAPACVEGSSQSCYSGPPATMWVGNCHPGTRFCTGGVWSNCIGEVTPGPEDCDLFDNDCDGLFDEEGPSCICTPGETKACYGGPPGTAGVGVCKAGITTCESGLNWTACKGEVLPTAENCGEAEDEDCDGVTAPDCAPLLWSKNIDLDVWATLHSNAAGEIAFTGSTKKPVTLGGAPLSGDGTEDVFAARLTAQGDVLWLRRFLGNGAEVATAGAIAPSGDVVLAGRCDNGTVIFGTTVLTCGLQYDIFVVKLSPTGDVLFARLFAGEFSEYALAVTADAAGAVYLGGKTGAPLDFDGFPYVPTQSEYFLVKLSATGAAQWVVPQRAESLAVHANGNILASNAAYSPAGVKQPYVFPCTGRTVGTPTGSAIVDCGQMHEFDLLSGKVSWQADPNYALLDVSAGNRVAVKQKYASPLIVLDDQRKWYYSRTIPGMVSVRYGAPGMLVHGGVTQPTDLGKGLLQPGQYLARYAQ